MRRVLKKNAIKPWRRVGWVIPPQRNADCAAGMERVLDIYRRPYDANFPVVCMDETPRQLIGEARTPVAAAAAPGRAARSVGGLRDQTRSEPNRRRGARTPEVCGPGRYQPVG